MTEPIKLIAVDMDGTLLRSDKTVDPQTITDIRAAVDRGIQVAYCTGRGFAEMQEVFGILPEIRYGVLNSGAVIYDRAEDKFIYSNGVQQPYIQQFVDLARQFSAMPHFLTDRESIVSKEDVTHMADFHMSVYQTMFQTIGRLVDDMAEEGLRHDSIAKLNIYFRTAEDRAKAYEMFKGLPLQLSLSENTTLEFTAPSTSKGTGLTRLAEYLNIPMEQTAAIGDNYNDTEMLKAAGFAIAMGNAIDEIREMCDHITTDNDHNGVGQAIRYIMSL